ncbi:heterokaryon incompatibility protein-domain-containing protein [Podospora fimiseda]|uniref:Heterokaryon incompatibility protein-domain-containing protein n=1 Tax=Podospora fimiseda TaxID=252190 RepID=A0AAN7BPM8_9PEZI|nr:heterokaryon incompatibility protein-domain-containing protein [Podospora fimiseda]
MDTSEDIDLVAPTAPCPFCHDLNPKRGPESRSIGTDPGVLVDLRVVKSRSSEGCHKCEIIEKALTLLDPEWQTKIDPPGGECRGVPRPLDGIDLSHYYRASQGLKERLQVVLDWVDDCKHEHFGRCTETNSPARLMPTKRWDSLRFKVKEVVGRKPGYHSTTLKSHQAAMLPKRVLDLRKFGSEGKLCLLETAGYQNQEHTYACFSYCWGAKNACITTATTLTSHLKDIPWAGLPQTYKDAIQVASALELRFLWIDALCIIQGDQRDWEYYAAAMANIYGNSLLVISAVDASDVTQGFLRQPRTLANILEINTVFARKTLDHIWLESSIISGNDRIGQVPLWSRGWCLQEEILAPRLLSFYGDKFFFKCASGYYHCECGFHLGGSWEEHWRIDPIKTIFYNTSITFDPTRANDHWTEIREAYSMRKLTVPTDKLPALSGLAREIQKKYKLEYLAGHWKDDDLFASLCWKPRPGQPEAHGCVTSPYIAPSWSWMSCQCRISAAGFAPKEGERVVSGTKLISHEIKLASKDSTGAVLYGHLLVRGAFLRLAVEQQDEEVVWRNDQDLLASIDPGKIIREHDVVVCWLLFKLVSNMKSLVLRRVGQKRDPPPTYTHNSTAYEPDPWWIQRPTCNPIHGGPVPRFQIQDMILGLRRRTGCVARPKQCVALYCHHDLGGGAFICNADKEPITFQCRHLAADLEAIANTCAPPRGREWSTKPGGDGGYQEVDERVADKNDYMYRARFGQARPSDHTRIFLANTGKKCRMYYSDEKVYGS